jgi:hypothetical protein
MNITEGEMAPGSIGPLIDDLPLLTHAMVRPYVVAIVLHRGAVRPSEVYCALNPHATTSDLQVGAWSALAGDYIDSTRMELIVDEVLGEFVANKLLRYNGDQDLWVADESYGLSYWVTKVAELNAQAPLHLLKAAGPNCFLSPF